MDLPNDYRRALYAASSARETEIGTRPSKEELFARGAHYAPILDAFITPDRSARVLELGCGWGPFLAALHERAYANVEAIELNAECCAFVEATLGITPARADIIGYLSGARPGYDVIAAFDVIEHFKKDELLPLFDRILELLAPGGSFVFRVPNCASPIGLARFHSGFTHETAFTSESADELCRARGFTHVRSMPEPVFARSPGRTLAKRALRRVVEEVLYLANLGMIDRRFTVSGNLIACGQRPL